MCEIQPKRQMARESPYFKFSHQQMVEVRTQLFGQRHE